MMRRATAVAAVGLCLCGFASEPAAGQTLDPVFANDYSITDLGLPPAVPLCIGGLTFHEDDPNTLLIGGLANFGVADIFAITVTRDPQGHINGFAGPAFFYAQAYGAAPTPDSGGIDAGLTFGPAGVIFYCTFEDNRVGEIMAGSFGPDRIIDLTALGVAPSTGGITFVPPGMPGAGRLKIASWTTGLWYDSQIAPDGSGTFDIINVTNVAGVNLGPLPEAVIHLRAGNPQFAANSLLVCEYHPGNISAYQVDGNADPIQATKRNFMTDVDEIEGSVFDPVTGDLVLTVFCDNARVLVVKGFLPGIPCPADISPPSGGDGVVNAADLLVVINNWGPSGGNGADINSDGVVNAADLLAVINAWGPCP